MKRDGAATDFAAWMGRRLKNQCPLSQRRALLRQMQRRGKAAGAAPTMMMSYVLRVAMAR
ncbi:MAG: hypothetical protein HC828_21285 [Blastochloris sp.]|nr:hypothetical protein [Blastochloris sp.]